MYAVILSMQSVLVFDDVLSMFNFFPEVARMSVVTVFGGDKGGLCDGSMVMLSFHGNKSNYIMMI